MEAHDLPAAQCSSAFPLYSPGNEAPSTPFFASDDLAKSNVPSPIRRPTQFLPHNAESFLNFALSPFSGDYVMEDRMLPPAPCSPESSIPPLDDLSHEDAPDDVISEAPDVPLAQGSLESSITSSDGPSRRDRPDDLVHRDHHVEWHGPPLALPVPLIGKRKTGVVRQARLATPSAPPIESPVEAIDLQSKTDEGDAFQSAEGGPPSETEPGVDQIHVPVSVGTDPNRLGGVAPVICDETPQPIIDGIGALHGKRLSDCVEGLLDEVSVVTLFPPGATREQKQVSLFRGSNTTRHGAYQYFVCRHP
jgi:hypothetical protein